jgi:hypothetical protein
VSIEILTVSLSDESIQRVAEEIHRRITQQPATTVSNPPSPQTPQDAERSGFQQQGDPWLNQNPTPPVQQQQAAAHGYVQQQYSQQAPPQSQPQQQVPAVQQGPPKRFCPHGEMRFIPAGTTQQGKQYSAFYGCPLPRGDVNQCKAQYV